MGCIIHQCQYTLIFRKYSRVTNSSEKQLLTEESKTEISMGMENQGTPTRTLNTNIRTSYMNKKKLKKGKPLNTEIISCSNYIEHFIGGNIWY